MPAFYIEKSYFFHSGLFKACYKIIKFITEFAFGKTAPEKLFALQQKYLPATVEISGKRTVFDSTLILSALVLQFITVKMQF